MIRWGPNKSVMAGDYILAVSSRLLAQTGEPEVRLTMRDSKRSTVQVPWVTFLLQKAGFCHRVLHCNENPIYVFLFWELRGLRPNFHIHVSVSAKRSWENIINSQAHECWNWDWGRTIPFLGKFVSNFRYCVFAVWPLPLIKRGKADINHLNK